MFTHAQYSSRNTFVACIFFFSFLAIKLGIWIFFTMWFHIDAKHYTDSKQAMPTKRIKHWQQAKQISSSNMQILQLNS